MSLPRHPDRHKRSRDEAMNTSVRAAWNLRKREAAAAVGIGPKNLNGPDRHPGKRAIGTVRPGRYANPLPTAADAI